MYALRHGATGRVFQSCQGGRWLWPSVRAMKRSWEILRKAGIMQSEFEEHRVVEIRLLESDITI